MKVHLVFYISFLKPYKESNILGKIQPPLPCIEIGNHEKYKVIKVFNSRQRRGKLKYLRHWHAYDINKRIWESTINVINVSLRYRNYINVILMQKPEPCKRFSWLLEKAS